MPSILAGVLSVAACTTSASVPGIALPIFVSPAWFAEQRAEFQVVFASYGPPPADGEYSVVPGAIHINTDELEYDALSNSSQGAAAQAAKGIPEGGELPQNFWRLYPDEYLLPALAFAGITSESRVAVYGKDAMVASRVAWTMLKAGVQEVRVLNGGVVAWQEAGYAVSHALAARVPLASFGVSTSLRPHLSVDSEEVGGLCSTAPSGAVGDVRTRCEFDGVCAPYDYFKTMGRVAGAVWAHGGDTDPYHMEPYMLPNGQLRPVAEIGALWDSLGVCVHGGACAFYCGSGWRSGLATLVALELKRGSPANFDGGWYVYSLGPGADQNPMIPPSGNDSAGVQRV